MVVLHGQSTRDVHLGEFDREEAVEPARGLLVGRSDQLEEEHPEVPVAADPGRPFRESLAGRVDGLLVFFLVCTRRDLRGDDLVRDVGEDDELAPRPGFVLSEELRFPADHPLHLLGGFEWVFVCPGREPA